MNLLSEGSITLTTVTLLGRHLTSENHVAVLESARHKSKADVEMIVATLHPQRVDSFQPAIVRAIAPERYTLQLTISGETRAKLRRAQDLLWHAEGHADEATIIDRALTLLVERLEKVKYGRTHRPRRATDSDPGSRYVSAHLRRMVSERDGDQCAFVGVEGRCSETAGLEYHHRVPFC